MIRLLGVQLGYEPGQDLDFDFRLSRVKPEQLSAVEASIVWYTEGKGNEDLGVHFFQRVSGTTIAQRNWLEPQSVVCRLPAAPLSYEGRLIKIRWCVRVRAYLNDGTEILSQQPFFLGSLTREI